MKCEICKCRLLSDCQFINGKYYHNKCIEKTIEENQQLKKQLKNQDMSISCDGECNVCEHFKDAYLLEQENQNLGKRLKHLLKSNIISSFDEIDPKTKKYKYDVTKFDDNGFLILWGRANGKQDLIMKNMCEISAIIRIEKAINKINNMFNNGNENTVIDDLLELEKILKGDNNE